MSMGTVEILILVLLVLVGIAILAAGVAIYAIGRQQRQK